MSMFWVHQAKVKVKTDKRMIQNINTLLNGNMEMWEHRGDAPVTLKQRNEGQLPIIKVCSQQRF